MIRGFLKQKNHDLLTFKVKKANVTQGDSVTFALTLESLMNKGVEALLIKIESYGLNFNVT